MKRWNGLVLVALMATLALFSGCASIAKKSGFAWQERESFAVQEPWHNLVLRGYLSEIDEVAVSYIPLPQPLPSRLKEELIYVRPDGKEKVYLERLAFRGLLYRDESFVGMFDVFFDSSRKKKRFIPLLPLNGNSKSIYRYIGSDLNFFILLSNSKTIMTTRGKIVDLPKQHSLLELPDGFFQQHPSRMPRITVVRRSHPKGQKFLKRLKNEFPWETPLRGKRYSWRGNAEYVFSEFTSNEHALDRVLSCGSARFNLAMIFNPIVAAISVVPQTISNTRAISQENCDDD